jgi:hypothetical protein
MDNTNYNTNYNTNNTIKDRLKYVLELSKINHKKEILKQENLKLAHIYCKIHNLSGQISGPLIENYIQYKYQMNKNNSSECIGDLSINNINYEIKISLGGKDHNKFNFVQIRMNHVCDYFLIAYYISKENLDNLGELYIFQLNKENLKEIILKYGSYAHGTLEKLGSITLLDLNNNENDKEYALRPKYNDDCWKTLLKYRKYDLI